MDRIGFRLQEISSSRIPPFSPATFKDGPSGPFFVGAAFSSSGAGGLVLKSDGWMDGWF